MPNSLIVAATAALAATTWTTAGLLALRIIFAHRRLPQTRHGRILAFWTVQLFVLPTLDIIDFLATYGDWQLATRILPPGLEPTTPQPA